MSANVGESFDIVFTPSGRHGSVPKGTTVLEAARMLGVDLDTVCGGRGICGRCQVRPSEGEFPKWALTVASDALSGVGPMETDYRGRRPLNEGNRLGCAAAVCGDVVIDVPPESQIHRQVIRKDVRIDGLVVESGVSLHYLALDPTAAPVEQRVDGEDGSSIDVRLIRQLATDWFADDPRWSDNESGAEPPSVAPHLLSRLHGLGSDCTVALRGTTVVGAWPGFVDRALGVAVDVGSTTVAGHLCDLTTGEVLASAGRMNPQIRFGEDLMSRVSYVMMNPGGADALTMAIRSAIDELIAELLTEAGDEHDRTRILDVVLVGNPIMHHIALGIDPTPLGQAPFPLATAAAVTTTASALDLDLPFAEVYLAPCIAGHVGADTAAAILSEKPHRSDIVQLLVDVGTNAEIVLGTSQRLYAASSPTGPAFEGAQISGGQRATAGAIERVRIDRDTLEPRFRVIGCDLWSDEDGFEAGTARTGITGICGSGIIEVVAEMFLAGIIDNQGVIGPGPSIPPGYSATPSTMPSTTLSPRLELDGRTYRYRVTDTVVITQGDVRAIQLAKAALRAGIDLLLERSEWSGVDEIRLAGAFGAHIDPVYAMVLGLLPDCPVDRVRSVGNAAGSGAVRALLSRPERREMERAVRDVIKIETATEPAFQDLFVSALGLPHSQADHPNLSRLVDLPTATQAQPGTGRRNRRSRERSRPQGDRASIPGHTISPSPGPTTSRSKGETHE